MNGLSPKNLAMLSKTNQTPKHLRDPYSGLETGEKCLKVSVAYRFRFLFSVFILQKTQQTGLANSF